VVSDDPRIRLFNKVFGSSRIPSSAYQKWATKEIRIVGIGAKLRHLSPSDLFKV
jgi:hypothetical protein